jgi:hypothetical protein
MSWNGVGVTGMPMPTYTQPSGFLAATFPSGTIASTTNVTAGTITTVSNAVSLPTTPPAGYATSASQTSILAAVAAIPTNPLTTLGTNAPVNWFNAAAISADAVAKIDDGISTSSGAADAAAPTILTQLAELVSTLQPDGEGNQQFTKLALAQTPTGGQGQVNVTIEDTNVQPNVQVNITEERNC